MSGEPVVHTRMGAPGEMPVRVGQLLAYEVASSYYILVTVAKVNPPRKDGSVHATLVSYEGDDPGPKAPWASGEYKVTFPDGVIRDPFRLVTIPLKDVAAMYQAARVYEP